MPVVFAKGIVQTDGMGGRRNIGRIDLLQFFKVVKNVVKLPGKRIEFMLLKLQACKGGNMFNIFALYLHGSQRSLNTWLGEEDSNPHAEDQNLVSYL